MHYVAESCAVETNYYGHTGAMYKCSDYHDVLIIQSNLYAKAAFVTITK